MGYLFRTMSFARGPLYSFLFLFLSYRDILIYAFTLIYGLMVNSALFDTSNAQSQFALKFKSNATQSVQTMLKMLVTSP